MTYRGYEIFAFDDVGRKVIYWELFFNGNFVLRDFSTIDGGKLQSASHAINDAKRNIDAFYRLKINNL